LHQDIKRTDFESSENVSAALLLRLCLKTSVSVITKTVDPLLSLVGPLVKKLRKMDESYSQEDIINT
jgi:hypothetical protein